MKDAIDILIEDRTHPDAKDLLAFHHANLDFLPRVVAEFRLLKRLGRKAGGMDALIHFLRWAENWHGVDDFEINQNLGAIAIRVCTILWPDINGMVQFRHCEADGILGTRIVRRGRRYGNFLYPGKGTLGPSGSFLPAEKNCAGLVRPILFDRVLLVIPPLVPVLDRPPTFHSLITEAEAASIVEPLSCIATKLAPSASNPRLDSSR